VCGVVWCGVVWCGVVWCGAVWCGVVWCGVGSGTHLEAYFETVVDELVVVVHVRVAQVDGRLHLAHHRRAVLGGGYVRA